MMNTATQTINTSMKVDLGKIPIHFDWNENMDDVGISPALRAEIDRDIAISREQIRNGQSKVLNDAFIKDFLEKARIRSGKLLDGE